MSSCVLGNGCECFSVVSGVCMSAIRVMKFGIQLREENLIFFGWLLITASRRSQC